MIYKAEFFEEFFDELCERVGKEFIKVKTNSIYGNFGNYLDTDSIRSNADTYFSNMRLRQENKELKHQIEELKQQLKQANDKNYCLQDHINVQDVFIENLNNKLSQIQEIVK